MNSNQNKGPWARRRSQGPSGGFKSKSSKSWAAKAGRRFGAKGRRNGLRKPAVYAFSLSVGADGPALCEIAESAAADGESRRGIDYKLTELGEEVWREIHAIPGGSADIRMISGMIMPHKAEFVLWTRGWKRADVWSHLSGFLGACSRHHSAANGLPERTALFKRLNYRIVGSKEQLGALTATLADSPRRYMMLRKCPDLFKRYLRVTAGTKVLAAYGNIFLLRDFDRQQVVVHRADSFDSRCANERRWLACAANGGVLVSPFISPDEKAIRDKALAAGGRIIVVRHNGEESQFKPMGRELELCAAGRMLLLAPWPSDNAENNQLLTGGLSREKARMLNKFAAVIAALPHTVALGVHHSGQR